jgi:hypothetical protein
MGRASVEMAGFRAEMALIAGSQVAVGESRQPDAVKMTHQTRHDVAPTGRSMAAQAQLSSMGPWAAAPVTRRAWMLIG